MSVLCRIFVWVRTNIVSILLDHSHADVIVVIEKEEMARTVKVPTKAFLAKPISCV